MKVKYLLAVLSFCFLVPATSWSAPSATEIRGLNDLINKLFGPKVIEPELLFEEYHNVTGHGFDEEGAIFVTESMLAESQSNFNVACRHGCWNINKRPSFEYSDPVVSNCREIEPEDWACDGDQYYKCECNANMP